MVSTNFNQKISTLINLSWLVLFILGRFDEFYGAIMPLMTLLSALESGLIYGLMALGVLISFKILDFPDLTADGSFPLGGAVCAIAILAGVNPWLACLMGMTAGMVAGFVTAFLHIRLGIMPLLAGILTMTALSSINLRIMHAPNLSLLGQPTIFVGVATTAWQKVFVLFGVAVLFKVFLDWFLTTQIGLAMRATGANAKMAQAQGVKTSLMIAFGMALSNGLIALSGALFVQTQGFMDVSLGVGTIVIGLAAVIIGETVISSRKIFWVTVSVLVGSFLYRLFVQIALSSHTLRQIGFKSQDLNLITALLVVMVMMLPTMKQKLFYKGKK